MEKYLSVVSNTSLVKNNFILRDSIESIVYSLQQNCPMLSLYNQGHV